MVRRVLTHWAPHDPSGAQRAADSFHAFNQACAGRMLNKASDLVQPAREQLVPVIVGGLLRREHRILKPDGAALFPELLDDWLAWSMIALSAGPPPGRAGGMLGTLGMRAPLNLRYIAVCDACTQVFRPRRSGSLVCDLCRKRQPPQPLGSLEIASLLKGEPVTVRKPALFGRATVGWRSITLVQCSGCVEVLGGRTDKRTCGRCKTARSREDVLDGP